MDAIADRIGGSDAPSVPSATLDDVERWRQSPKRRRRIYLGFGVGVALGLVATAGQVAYQGYQVLPFLLISNLIIAPYVGLRIGNNLGRPRHIGPWKWRRPQIRTGTLMMVVAYVALLLGLGVSTQRLGTSAAVFYQKYGAATTFAKAYGDIGRKAALDAERARANVEGLRSGKIPEGLQPGQRDFLSSLEVDPKVTPDDRKYRRGLIQDGEEREATTQARNAVYFGRLADYNEQLAAKYDRARWRPWLPVEPDPPLPPIQ